MVPLSRASLAMPLYVTTTKNFASNCDLKAGRDGWMSAVRAFCLALGFQLVRRGSFPLAEHSSANQSSSRLHIVVEGVSH